MDLQPVVRGIDLEAVAELAETADDAEVGWEDMEIIGRNTDVLCIFSIRLQ